ncbi:MAG: hypothetical protein ACK5E3_13145 [Planctomycetota bacterium]
MNRSGLLQGSLREVVDSILDSGCALTPTMISEKSSTLRGRRMWGRRLLPIGRPAGPQTVKAN